MKYAARIKIWLLLDCNVQFSFEFEPCPQNSQMTTHFLKFLLIIEDACSPQDLVNAWTQSPEVPTTPALHSTPLRPILQMSNLKTHCRQARKRRSSNMMPPASHVMTKPCPVRDAATYPSSKSLPEPAVYFWQIAWTTIFQDRFRKLSKLGKYRVLPEG